MIKLDNSQSNQAVSHYVSIKTKNQANYHRLGQTARKDVDGNIPGRQKTAFYALVLMLMLMSIKSLFYKMDPPVPWSPRLVRLAPSLEPLNCFLQWVVNPDGGNFGGRVVHEFRVVNATRDIILHSVDLDVSHTDHILTCSLMNETMLVHPTNKSPYLQTIQFHLVRPLILQDVCNLTVYFGSQLETKYSWGFFRQSYQSNHTKDPQYVTATHFEPTGARSAFPCFDEPAMKSVFHVSIVTSADYHVVSNTPLKSRQQFKDDSFLTRQIFTNPDDLVLHHFEPTPKMSSYLVAAAISKLDKISNKSDNVLVNVYSQPDQQHQVTLALDVACYCVSFYARYFGIGYPIPKLDLVPVPFFSGEAMENWGLNIYDNTLFTYDARYNTVDEKQYTALLVAHEIAHQWFGNLVTMKWWDDLWLNEGFAEYLQYLGGYNPDVGIDFDADLLFFMNEHLLAFEADASNYSHSIASKQKDTDPIQIASMFDDITYNKGASVIRMLASWLGDTMLTRGLQVYLQQYQYSSATSEDLWNTLDSVANLSNTSVSQVMTGWVYESGFPVVELVKEFESSNHVIFKLVQYRYSLWMNHSLIRKTKEWYTPVTLVSICKYDHALETRRDTFEMHQLVLQREYPYRVTISKCNNNELPIVLVNPGRKSFVKTSYSQQEFIRLVSMLGYNREAFLGAADRLGLLSDSVSFLVSHIAADHPEEYAHYYLSTLRWMRQESDPLVWRGFVEYVWSVLDTALSPNMASFAELRRFAQWCVDPWVQEIDWKKAGNTSITRVEFAIKVGHPTLITLAVGAFDTWLASHSPEPLVDPLFIDCILLAGVQHTRYGYNRVYELFITSNTTLTESLFLALCQAVDVEQQSNTLTLIQKLILSPQVSTDPSRSIPLYSRISATSITKGLTYIAQSSLSGPHLVWNFILKFLKDEWMHTMIPILNAKMSHVIQVTVARLDEQQGELNSVRRVIQDLGHRNVTQDTMWMQRLVVLLKDGLERAEAYHQFRISTWGNIAIKWFHLF